MQKKALFLIPVVLFAAIAISCTDDNETQSEKMLNENLDCPDNAQSEFAVWGGGGKTGWAHSCTLKHGKYVVWVKGIKIVEGAYYNGLKEGEWIYRDERGEITTTTHYLKGQKIDSPPE